MPVAGYTTPCRTETFENLILNAGAFLVDFDYSNIANADALATAVLAALDDPDKCLGATRGGGTFVATREIREPEVDGKRYRFKGGSFVDSVDAYLTGTLVEGSPENFARLQGGVATTPTGSKKTTVSFHTRIENTDYLDNLCWVGDLSDGRMILISLKNALNTGGINMTFTDKGEATLPFEMHAYQDSVEDYDTPPFEIVYFDRPTV